MNNQQYKKCCNIINMKIDYEERDYFVSKPIY